MTRSADRFKAPVVALFGLAFKANIDDLRESPAVHIAEQLGQQLSARVLAVEPNITELPDSLAQAGVELASLSDALAAADIVVGLVDHNEFKSLSRDKLQSLVVLDYRGMWR